MSPQVSYALKRAGVLMLIALLGVGVNEYTNVLAAFGDYAWAGPVVVALLGAGLRWAEGLRDAQRAEEGDIQKSDVGFEKVVNLENYIQGVK